MRSNSMSPLTPSSSKNVGKISENQTQTHLGSWIEAVVIRGLHMHEVLAQQLNFAAFWATQAWGIFHEIFDSGLSLPPQMRAFTNSMCISRSSEFCIRLHKRFAERPNFQSTRQSVWRGFIQKDKQWVWIDASSDFRFTHGKKHGLGSVYVYAQLGATKTDAKFLARNSTYRHLTGSSKRTFFFLPHDKLPRGREVRKYTLAV